MKTSMFNLFRKKQILTQPNLPQVIIHIGSPKTGSSAIQKYMLENRKALLQLGIFYPQHGLDENGISGGHSNIGRHLIEGNIQGAQELLHEYLEQAKRENCSLFLSAESFYIRAEEFTELTKNIDYRIICFLRNPLESIYSNYNQGIKRNNSTFRLEVMCKRLAGKPGDFFSGKIIEKWAELHGEEKLTVIEYAQDRFRETSIQQTLLQAIGFDRQSLDAYLPFDTKFINNSYTLAALELKRMINFVIDSEQKKLNHQIDWFLQGISDQNQNRDQIFYLEDRISTETYQLLSDAFLEKFLNIRQKLIKPSQQWHPTEDKNKAKKSVNLHQLNNEIYSIFVQLKDEKTELYEYIDRQLQLALEQKKFSFEVLKLAELFNIDINQFEDKNIWFSENKLNKMPNFKAADFLRDIAALCLQKNDLKNAQNLVNKAHELRPHGKGIISLKESIDKATKNEVL